METATPPYASPVLVASLFASAVPGQSGQFTVGDLLVRALGAGGVITLYRIDPNTGLGRLLTPYDVAFGVVYGPNRAALLGHVLGPLAGEVRQRFDDDCRAGTVT